MQISSLVTLISGLFFIIGIYFLLVKEFRDPTVWKFYFPPFYEETSKSSKLIVYRKLKNKVKIALGWYFLITGVLIFILLIFANLQCGSSIF